MKFLQQLRYPKMSLPTSEMECDKVFLIIHKQKEMCKGYDGLRARWLHRLRQTMAKTDVIGEMWKLDWVVCLVQF